MLENLHFRFVWGLWYSSACCEEDRATAQNLALNDTSGAMIDLWKLKQYKLVSQAFV